MKNNKKRFLATGMLTALILSSMNVNASGYGISDCTPSITLEKTKGIFQIFEGGEPLNPITPKRIDGLYVIVDINGYTRQKDVSGSITRGQLRVVKNADTHYQSQSGKMAYYLNGSYSGSIEKTY